MDLLISGGHIGVPKLYANMASPHKASQSYLKHFGKQLRNCGSQRPETWQNCLYISLFMKFYFFGFVHWTVSNLFISLCCVYCVTVKNDLHNNDDGDDEEEAKDYSSYPIQSCRNVT